MAFLRHKRLISCVRAILRRGRVVLGVGVAGLTVGLTISYFILKHTQHVCSSKGGPVSVGGPAKHLRELIRHGHSD